MKKLVVLLCALLLPLTAALADMTRSDAVDLAYGVMRQSYGYAPEALRLSQAEGFSDKWVVSFIVADHPDDTDGLYVLFFSPSGELLDVSEPTEQTLSMQVGNDLQVIKNARGASHDAQSHERLAAFTEKWKPRRDEIAEHLEDPTLELAALGLNARMPDKDAMPYDQALETAVALLARQPGFSDDTARMYMILFDGYIQPEGFERPVWSFYFYWNTERYGDALDRAFNNDPPIAVSLLFDAADGALAAAPIIEYRGAPFSMYDVFARTPAVLAYYAEEEEP